MTLDYKDPKKPELDEIAKEINGKDLATGKQMASFALLKADGTTTSGDWIYIGSFTDDGNLMARRNGVQDPAKNDPTGMGYYPTWAWSWPANRRVLYNRASADKAGKPWDPQAPGDPGHARECRSAARCSARRPLPSHSGAKCRLGIAQACIFGASHALVPAAQLGYMSARSPGLRSWRNW